MKNLTLGKILRDLAIFADANEDSMDNLEIKSGGYSVSIYKDEGDVDTVYSDEHCHTDNFGHGVDNIPEKHRDRTKVDLRPDGIWLKSGIALDKTNVGIFPSYIWTNRGSTLDKTKVDLRPDPLWSNRGSTPDQIEKNYKEVRYRDSIFASRPPVEAFKSDPNENLIINLVRNFLVENRDEVLKEESNSLFLRDNAVELFSYLRKNMNIVNGYPIWSSKVLASFLDSNRDALLELYKSCFNETNVYKGFNETNVYKENITYDPWIPNGNMLVQSTYEYLAAWVGSKYHDVERLVPVDKEAQEYFASIIDGLLNFISHEKWFKDYMDSNMTEEGIDEYTCYARQANNLASITLVPIETLLKNMYEYTYVIDEKDKEEFDKIVDTTIMSGGKNDLTKTITNIMESVTLSHIPRIRKLRLLCEDHGLRYLKYRILPVITNALSGNNNGEDVVPEINEVSKLSNSLAYTIRVFSSNNSPAGLDIGDIKIPLYGEVWRSIADQLPDLLRYITKEEWFIKELDNVSTEGDTPKEIILLKTLSESLSFAMDLFIKDIHKCIEEIKPEFINEFIPLSVEQRIIEVIQIFEQSDPISGHRNYVLDNLDNFIAMCSDLGRFDDNLSELLDNSALSKILGINDGKVSRAVEKFNSSK